MLFGRHNQDHLCPFLGPELAMVGFGISVNKIAGPETPAAGEDAARHDEAFFRAAVMMRGKAGKCGMRR